jgi:hypothetical protein
MQSLRTRLMFVSTLGTMLLAASALAHTPAPLELDARQTAAADYQRYCACPHAASGRVVDALRAHDIPNTAIIDEGVIVWTQRGYPIQAGW